MKPIKKAMVVNVRNAAYDVLVDRTTKWGSPYTHVRDRTTRAQHIVATRVEAIACYEIWLKSNPALMACLPELKGKVLGCWCAPLACHADVLVRLANGGESDENDEE